MPFGASPGPAFNAELKVKNPSFFALLYINFRFSPLEVEGPGAPPL